MLICMPRSNLQCLSKQHCSLANKPIQSLNDINAGGFVYNVIFSQVFTFAEIKTNENNYEGTSIVSVVLDTDDLKIHLMNIYEG